ncbi:hypothetical protein PM082_016741 [Marasmius tenuissimus]|nr:hypothetical protein PM082_016741 [Marasmius tenuissimus]
MNNDKLEETIRRVEAGYESEDGLRSTTPKPGVRVRVEQVATEQEVVAEHQELSADTGRSMPGDDRSRMPGRRTQQSNQSRRPTGHTGNSGPTNSGPTPISPSGPGGHTISYSPAQPDHAPPPTYAYPPSTSFSQSAAFYGAQYTMPPQQPPTMAMATYPFSHGYQHQHHVPPDPGLMSQNIHANYRSMIPPYAYQQQRQSSDNNSAHSGYSNAPLFSPPTPPNNPGAFQSLRYPSPMPPSSQYATYHQTPAAFSPTAMYQSPQFNYPRPFASSPEAEGQGTWWYLPHLSHQHQPQYEGNPSQNASYQTPPYTMGYSPQVQEMDNSFPASSTGSSIYPMSSTVHTSPHSHVARPPSTSISPPPAAVPPPVAPPAPPPDPAVSRTRTPHTPSVTAQGKPSGPPSASLSAQPTRKPYHPNPPAHRSEWVMWSGNVPPDATHDELWRFFNQKPTTPSGRPSPESSPWHSGVLSIFLISRSSCAFINYENEVTLQSAINRFNGLPLRPNDPRCPRLVCRVRKKDDDLRAGVGGQRGVGMHTKWVKDQRVKPRTTPTPALDQQEHSDLESSASNTTEASSSSLLTSEGETSQRSIDGIASDGRLMRLLIPRGGGHSNSSGSYASTNSSMLNQWFPKRFFILKSLSQFDLDLSVEKGLWATQKHNEGILDQAYRTSSEVYLIFGVNKSGEFYGYARMAGPVKQGEHRVSWGPRTDSSSSTRSSLSPVTGRAVQSDTIFEEPASPTRVLGEGFDTLNLGATHNSNRTPAYFSGRMVEDSPQPFSNNGSSPGQSRLFDAALSPRSVSGGADSYSSDAGQPDERRTAPAELGHQHKKITMQTPTMKFSLDNRALLKEKASSIAEGNNFQLDEDAPIRAMKNPSPESKSMDAMDEEREDGQIAEMVQQAKGKGKAADVKGKGRAATMYPDGDATPAKDEPTSWGDSFKVEWLCTERLSFLRTRHIRNPWNHDREIKVSRDGTELEPVVGQQLLDEWDKFVQEVRSGVVSSPTNEEAAEKPTPVKKGGSRLSSAGAKRNG